jgi:2-oxoglutarate ferredoxin oxidoreductase subunit gamma
MALNQPSVDKFESKVKPGGLMIYDSTNILNPPTRKDIDVVPVPAADEANRLNNTKVTNMIMLGAYLAKRTVVF